MITTRAREGGPKEYRVKQQWQRETHSVTYVSMLSTLSDLSRIGAQPPPSFLCCPMPPSHHPSRPTSVYLVPAIHYFRHQAINTLLAILYSSIFFLSTCPNHLNMICPTRYLPFYSSPPAHLFNPKSSSFLIVNNIINYLPQRRYSRKRSIPQKTNLT